MVHYEPPVVGVGSTDAIPEVSARTILPCDTV